MAKARKISDQDWEYRGGNIFRFPGPGNGFGNWNWSVCGVSGWSRTRSDAKAKIDSILSQAKAILDSEERSPVHGKGRA